MCNDYLSDLRDQCGEAHCSSCADMQKLMYNFNEVIKDVETELSKEIVDPDAFILSLMNLFGYVGTDVSHIEENLMVRLKNAFTRE